MLESRLIQLLKTFSQKEVRSFSDFVSSPYYNKSNKTKILAQSILKCHPHFNKIPSEEKLFEKIANGEKYDYFKFRNYISDILELALQFLKTEMLNEKNIAGDIALLENLRLHKQNKIYEREFYKIEKKIIEEVQPGAFNFLQKFWLKREESIYYSLVNPNTHHELTQFSFDAFIEYAILECMDFYGLMLHEQMQNNVPYQLKLFDAVIHYAEENYSHFNIITKIYVDMLRMMQDLTNKKNYGNLRDILRENQDKIPHVLLERGYIHLIDFCAYQINKLGNNEYITEVNEINKDLFKYKIQTKETLVYMDFLNIAKMAATAKDFVWLEQFVEEYIPYMPEEERENCLNFINAFICYYKSEFGEAAKYMSAVNFRNHIMKIQVKQFTIRFLYEVKLYDQIMAALDAFTHFLKREAMLPEEIIACHEKFITYTRELIKADLLPDKKEKREKKEKLSVEVSKMNANYFGTRNWLRKKLIGT